MLALSYPGTAMMIEFTHDDFEDHVFVDRDSCLNDFGSQGFDVTIGSTRMHFEDERDLVTLAKVILSRMGEL